MILSLPRMNTTRDDQTPIVPLAVRAALGGTLMGMANLVPGISGGTMLLASGVYPRFIDAISDPDRAAAKRAFEAMMTMRKIDIAAIEAARRG